MGYTNYYYRKPTLDATKFASFSEDVAKIIKAAPCKIAGGLGKGKPTVNATSVWFNGKGEDSHETFDISQTETGRVNEDGLVFAFCKTARKPYDIVVVAVLTALKYHFGNEVKVSSDGDLSDWEAGMRLFEQACSKVAPSNPLED